MPREFSRSLRLNVQLQRELSALIRSELTDPRVTGVSVTAVSVSPDLRNARISVSLLGEDAQLNQAVKALNGAGSRLRRGLGHNLKMRYVPALHFVPDSSLREGDRIGVLIRQATASDRAAREGEADGIEPAE